MDHRNRLIALLALALCLGCASARWSLIKHFRSPGAELATFPEAIWEEYDCANQTRPFFVIEKNELLPEKVAPGASFGHRWVYAMCPERSTEVVEGVLSRRIRYRGVAIVEKTDPLYAIKPGRWVVDTVVHLPNEAELGVYAYELEFEGAPLAFEKSATFVVEAR